MTDQGAVLDALADELRECVGPDQALTSDELAARLDLAEAHDTNPETRELVKAVMRERDLPVAGTTVGYWIPEHDQHVDEVIEQYRSRIAGINERMILLRETWADWEHAIRLVNCDRCGSGIERSDAMWPKEGDYEGETPFCRNCYGRLVMQEGFA